MKIFSIIAIMIILFLLSELESCKNSFKIKKVVQKDLITYEIYKQGALIQEFTNQNTDSLSLETLELILED